MGIELVRSDAHGKTVPDTDRAEFIMYEALRRGLNFKVTMGNILTLTPALVLTREELDQAIDILDACLSLAPS
jgi:4-aminobutyrate aminotransferase